MAIIMTSLNRIFSGELHGVTSMFTEFPPFARQLNGQGKLIKALFAVGSGEWQEKHIILLAKNVYMNVLKNSPNPV